MSAAISSTLIGVLGGGLFGFLLFQFRTITGALIGLTDQLKTQGERLARIEAKLDNNPPRLKPPNPNGGSGGVGHVGEAGVMGEEG